jgi:hypothetical protein
LGDLSSDWALNSPVNCFTVSPLTVSQKESRAWLVDPSTGAVVTYAEMLDAITTPVPIRHLCQPATTRDALGELIRAAAAGVRLTLLDPSLTANELRRLEIDPAEINRVRCHPLRQDVGAFPRWLAGANQAEVDMGWSGGR